MIGLLKKGGCVEMRVWPPLLLYILYMNFSLSGGPADRSPFEVLYILYMNFSPDFICTSLRNLRIDASSSFLQINNTLSLAAIR